jgi:membrane-anchored protein YejM (alkaline phosphatase superfamily)
MTAIFSTLTRIYHVGVSDSFHIVRREGWRELWRRRGWKFLAAVFACYLVRDTLIYVVLPLLIARGLF